jgi:hypothetical protein
LPAGVRDRLQLWLRSSPALPEVFRVVELSPSEAGVLVAALLKERRALEQGQAVPADVHDVLLTFRNRPDVIAALVGLETNRDGIAAVVEQFGAP